MHRLATAGLALALLTPPAAFADAAADLAALRQEMEALRVEYAARLRALDERLKAAEAAIGQAPGAAAAPAQPTAPSAPPALGPAAPAAAPAANAFNPALSLILSGLYTRTSRDPSSAPIAGFARPLSGETGAATRGLALGESELGLSASIDPWWRGAATLALHADNALSVEEAYVETTGLGGGFGLRLGRFLAELGYLNAQHAHAWDFVDAPLAYQAMLGGGYGQDGARLRWVAPTDLLVELSAEIGRGSAFPGTDSARNGIGAATFGLHLGGDAGDSHSWRVGVSALGAKAQDQALRLTSAASAEADGAFSGSTRVWLLDGVWKWAPGGNATRTNFKLQAEWLRSTRSGTLVLDPAGAASAGRWRATQSGAYVQGLWQFMPRWRVGWREERLDAGDPDFGANAGALAARGGQPRKHSALLDFAFSEFSRVRAQWALDRAREGGVADRQFLLQYQMSLGAHGAHGF